MAQYTPAERTAILAQAVRVRAASATLAQPAARARSAVRATRDVVARRRVDWAVGDAGTPHADAEQPAWNDVPFWLRCWLALDAVDGVGSPSARTSSGADLVAALDTMLEALTKRARGSSAAPASGPADAVAGGAGGPQSASPQPAGPRRTNHFRPPLQRSPG